MTFSSLCMKNKDRGTSSPTVFEPVISELGLMCSTPTSKSFIHVTKQVIDRLQSVTTKSSTFYTSFEM